MADPRIAAMLAQIGASANDYGSDAQPRAFDAPAYQDPGAVTVGGYQVFQPVEQPAAVPLNHPSALDSLGLGFAANPVEAPSGSGFLAHFLAGFTQGMGSAAAAKEAQRVGLEQRLRARAAAINARNIQLSDEARKTDAELALQNLKNKGALAVKETPKPEPPPLTPKQRYDQIKADAAARTAGEQSAKPPEASADYSGVLFTTQLGNKFIDAADISPKEIAAARDWAKANGAVVVTKDQAAKLRQLQTAKTNMDDIMARIGGGLPADAASRATNYAKIRLSQALQTDADRAAFATFRTAAINNLQALAGGLGSGLRLNQAEINMAIQNDIPRLTDTYPVAQAKIQILRGMFDNVERPMFQRNWTPSASVKTVRMKAPDGGELAVPNNPTDIAKAKAAGAVAF